MNWVERISRYWFTVKRWGGGSFSFLFIFLRKRFANLFSFQFSIPCVNFNLSSTELEFSKDIQEREKFWLSLWKKAIESCALQCLKIFWSLLRSVFLTILVDYCFKGFQFQILGLKFEVHSTQKFKTLLNASNNLDGRRFKAELFTI